MLPSRFFIIISYTLIVLHLTINVSADQFGNDDTRRAIYLSNGSPLAKGGWRPILTSDTLTAHFANMLGGQTVGQKLITGPALIETKVISPHIVNVSPFTSDIFANGIISTSTRPLVTRDANKLTTIAQAYKTSLYPQNNVNLNAPVNSYLNPFALPTGPGVSAYKFNPGYQYENAIYIKHQQPMMTHRPGYNKHSAQFMLGKRLKQNQMQSHMLQQMASNNYHHPIQVYQNTKKPFDSFHRPLETYKKPADSFSKPNNLNFQKPVNPHESLQTQTKTKHQPGHNVAAVTYKPPFNSHFQQFSIKEEPFGPIPSSILGSFSSFGHASVKAREPTYSIKLNHSVSTTTSAPITSTTESFLPVSTSSSVKKYPAVDQKNAVKQNNIRNVNDDYTRNLMPPPKVSSYIITHNTSNDNKPHIKGNFIPSPPDPLNKKLNPPEILGKLTSNKNKEVFSYNTNLPTKRPELSSFFDTASPVSTVDPFDSQTTNVVPENFMVQLPPPHATSITFGHPLKFENSVHKENYQIQHPKSPVGYNIFDEHKYFPSTRGQELFGAKFVKNNQNNQELNTKTPYKGYEVTENWSSSGETNTQPTLHTWINKPAHSYKHYNTGLKPPPLPPSKINIKPNHENRIIPISFSPPPPPPRGPDGTKSAYTTISSVYSTIQNSDEQHKTFFSELEDSLSSLAELHDDKPTGDESYDLAAPFNVTFAAEQNIQPSTTSTYEEVTSQRNNVRRKPSKNRNQYETSTIASISEDLKEFTTDYETFKEPVNENENNVNELPTLPPNKHFKRPIITTPLPLDNWEENKLKRKNKNRRRRPSRVSSTTEEIQETTTLADHPTIRSSRYRTTTLQPEIEDSTKPIRTRARYPYYKSRFTTRPTSQPELTSSAQPTAVPTSPITVKSKLHSRIRHTTLSSLDIDDLLETTTLSNSNVQKTVENNYKQSSIMKIAKDNHANRLPPVKPYSYENFNEKPDYSHKQDEKDTPTSDIAISTSDHKYSAQKFDKHENNNKEVNDFITNVVEQTSQSYIDESLSETNIETTKTEQLFNEQKLGNRGSKKQDKNSREKPEASEINETIEVSEISGTSSTTPISTDKTQRNKSKPGKYDSNRPRFSVKDYRNRLNQMTSTSTEKSVQAEVSTRIRFPNRSRFPTFKEQPSDSKPLDSEISTSTEQPRKKFTPKDPRHRGVVNDDNTEEKSKDKISSNNNEQENEIATKPTLKYRGNLRRDPNHTRSTTTVEPLSDVSEKTPQKQLNTYTNLKRPTLSLRKRISTKNSTVETIVQNVSETNNVITSTETVTVVEEKNETSTEKYTSETAIMKIAKDDKKHPTSEEIKDNPSAEITQRVSDLTMASGKEYSTPGLFKSVSPNTRKVPNYFTIATDDPILPIEAFFPQLNQKKDS